VRKGASPWVGNIALALVAIAVTMAGFEVALRWFLPQKLYRFPAGLFRNDPDLVFALNPGFQGTLANPEYRTHVRIDAMGLRGPEIGAKPPGGMRVLGLGDSFVSAFNMEEADTFLSVAGGAIGRGLPGRSVEVVNAGTPNYGTWHELRLLRRLASSLEPDAVVLCVYVGNDLENNLSPREATVKEGLLVERQSHPGILPYPLRSWLQRNSMAYVFLWNAWNHLRPWFGRTETDPLRAEKDLFAVEAPGGVEDGYRVSGELLRQVRDEAASRDLPLLVVLIPIEFQVYPTRFEESIRRQGEDPLRFDLDLPSRRWNELARTAGLPVLDLLPVFRSHVSGPYLYMTLDGHLTVEGNRLAGEAIAGALLSRLRPGFAEGAS
jgi:acetyltransferase AlgX (SGNH hydrolase-like protein)